MCPGARASHGSANSLHSRLLPHAAERRPARGGPCRPTTRKIEEKREIVPFTLGPAGAWLPWTLPLAQTPGDTKTTHRWPAGPRKGPAPSPAARRQGNARAGPGPADEAAGTRRGGRTEGTGPSQRLGLADAVPRAVSWEGTSLVTVPPNPAPDDDDDHLRTSPNGRRALAQELAAPRFQLERKKKSETFPRKSEKGSQRVAMGSAPSRGLGRASARSRDAPDVGPA